MKTQMQMKTILLTGILMCINLLSSIGQNLDWAKRWGGSNEDVGKATCVDNNGNVYVTGYFMGSVDFDPNVGTLYFTASQKDVFVSKFTASGDLIWTKTWGGSGNDEGCDIVVDENGNVYVTGKFSLTADFDPNAGTFFLTAADGGGQITSDVFLTKLDADGNFIWAKHWGGSGSDIGNSVAVDPNDGSIAVTGFVAGGVDYDPSAGVDYLSGNGSFISKFNSNGDYQWAKVFQSVGTFFGTSGSSIEIGEFGDVYSTGSFNGTVDFNPSGTSDQLAADYGYGAGYINKLGANGSYKGTYVLVPLGSIHIDISGLALGENDNIYITGGYGGVIDFSPYSDTLAIESFSPVDGFVAKLDSNGVINWVSPIHGAGNSMFACSGNAIVVDSNQDVYIAGIIQDSVIFEMGGAEFILDPGQYGQGENAFVAKYGPEGDFVWAAQVEGVNVDYGGGIAASDYSDVYSTGSFQGIADFDPSDNSFDLVSAGNHDVFLWKLRGDGTVTSVVEDYKPNFLCYPNPTSGDLMVEINEADQTTYIKVWNAYGQRVKYQTFPNQVRFPVSLPEPAGMYLIEVGNSNGRWTTERVIKR